MSAVRPGLGAGSGSGLVHLSRAESPELDGQVDPGLPLTVGSRVAALGLGISIGVRVALWGGA